MSATSLSKARWYNEASAESLTLPLNSMVKERIKSLADLGGIEGKSNE
jgi:hypothetical protein